MIESISVSTDASELLITKAGGANTSLSAIALRMGARDAISLRERIDHGEIKVVANITITGLELVGSTGINVKFSDGHDRAIYPMAYLNELMQSVDK